MTARFHDVMRNLALTGLLTGLLAGTALAQQPASVQVREAWARATPPGASTGVVYMSLVSPAGDRLVSASSPAARTAELHTMTMQNNVMRMRPMPNGLNLPAGKTVSLSVGGDHIMLEGLNAPLKEGGTVPLHLVFEKAPPVDITAPIEAIGARSPSGAAGRMPGMPGMNMSK